MNDLDLCLEVVSRSRQPLRYIWRWVSRKSLEIEAWFQRTTSRKWHMGCRMVTWPMTSHDLERPKSWPQYAQRAISWKLLELEPSNLVCSFVLGMPSGRTNNFPWKWAWPRSRDAYSFWHTIEHISKTTWARDFKFGERHLTYHCYLTVGFCMVSAVRQYGRLS